MLQKALFLSRKEGKKLFLFMFKLRRHTATTGAGEEVLKEEKKRRKFHEWRKVHSRSPPHLPRNFFPLLKIPFYSIAPSTLTFSLCSDGVGWRKGYSLHFHYVKIIRSHDARLGWGAKGKQLDLKA
jgi:hypothetical protein